MFLFCKINKCNPTSPPPQLSCGQKGVEWNVVTLVPVLVLYWYIRYAKRWEKQGAPVSLQSENFASIFSLTKYFFQFRFSIFLFDSAFLFSLHFVSVFFFSLRFLSSVFFFSLRFASIFFFSLRFASIFFVSLRSEKIKRLFPLHFTSRCFFSKFFCFISFASLFSLRFAFPFRFFALLRFFSLSFRFACKTLFRLKRNKPLCFASKRKEFGFSFAQFRFEPKTNGAPQGPGDHY